LLLLQILRQFGELPEDLVDVQRYAAWKAADIRKALREGRQPTPGNGNAAPDDLLPGVPPHEVRVWKHSMRGWIASRR